jgi:Holliday junction resolvase RusA-like endonuclease
MLSFTVPATPPSVNHYKQPYVRRGRIHYYVKPEAQMFKLMVRDAAAGRTVAPATKRERDKVRYGLSVRVVLGPGQRGDGDNFFKCIADGLVDAGVIHSDARVSRWLLEVDDKERREPRTEIRIEVL